LKDEKECGLGNDIFDILGLSDIRENPDILARIKFDVTPRMVMEPRFGSNQEDLLKLAEISGYMFYVESQCEPPALMLLKVGQRDVTSTVGKIDEIPGELVRKAIENPADTPSNGMYAITDEIKGWLKKELQR